MGNMRRLLTFFMLLAMAIPLWASEHTVTIHRNEGLYQDGSGVYYCVKDGIMMTFTGGLDNSNFLLEMHLQKFEVNSYNYLVKRIVFHCVDNALEGDLESFYWGPTTISIFQNFYNQSDPGNYQVLSDGYTGVWTGTTNHIQFTTSSFPVRFGSVEIVYDKLDGDIFDLVTNINQIQEGKTYVAVSQQYNKVMKVKKTDDVTIPATDIVEWMGPEGQEKTRVKVDGNALLFKMDNVRDSLSGTRKGAILNTLNGYIRENMGGSGKNLMLSTGLTAYNSSVMYLGTAYNWLCWFRSGSSNSSNPIRYDNSADGFKIMSYNDASTRVFLYKLAEAYNISTVCDPSAGGSIELGTGVVNNTSQGGEIVNFSVDIADGFSLSGVDVTIDGTTTTVPVTDNGDGTYSFVMPAQDVTVTAHFEIAGAYQILTENTPAGGGVVNVGGQVTTVDNNHYADNGNNVIVTPSPNWGWESTGVTVTDANGGNVTITDNGNGSYSFTMPENDVTVHASYNRTIGDIFDLVTLSSQIQEGKTYIIVSQTYDKVMRYWTPGQTTFASADIVDWPLGNDNKSKVRVDDNAVFFRMDNLNSDTTSTGGLNLTRAAFFNTLNGYMRTGNYNVFLSSPLAQVNRGSMMVSSNANNYLLRFLYDNTSGSNTNFVVRYDNGNSNFGVLNWTSDVNTRVWLYKLADSYAISTVCSPPQGGHIDLTGGADGNNKAQGGETVTFWVGTNWGWRISEVVVTNNTTGETTTLSPVTIAADGNNYSFVMPDGNVTITASFYESENDLYLLGTAMGRTNWAPSGPRFTYSPSAEEYYIDVYFTGTNDNASDRGYGYFSLAQHISGFDWTDREASADGTLWNQVTGRLAAVENNTLVQGGTSSVLYGDRPNNAFKIPAGVYRITVNRALTQMSITEIPLTLTFTPPGDDLENGTLVPYGQVVVLSSNIQSLVWPIAQSYGLTEPAQDFNIKTGEAAWSMHDNDTEITQTVKTVVQGMAYLDSIKVTGIAAYRALPPSHNIDAMWFPQNGGYITVASSALEGDNVTFTVALSDNYTLTSLTVTGNTNGQTISYTDNGDGTYSFVMPDQDVIIIANFSLLQYNIHTVCNPPEGGSIDGVPSASVAGTTVSFTVTPESGYEVNEVTLTNEVTHETITLTPDVEGNYSFTMPDGAVTITAYFASPLSEIESTGTTERIYTVSDELIGTWSVDDGDVKYLWAKDQGNRSNEKVDIPTDQVDYMVNVGLQKREWDQSNWVILDFKNIDDEPENYVNKTISAGSVRGVYADDVNFRMELTKAPAPQTVVVGYPGYNGDYNETSTHPDSIYYYNQYMSFNFLPSNLVPGGVAPGNDISPAVDTSIRFFFMNPKIQEVTHVMGVWIEDDMFSVFSREGNTVNGYDLDGIFKVNWDYNRLYAAGPFGKPAGLNPGTLYSFHAAVFRDVDGQSGGRMNAPKPNGDANTPSYYEVRPFDLPPSPSPPTAIKNVAADKVVDSIRYYNIMGCESTVPFQGINVMVVRYTDGSSLAVKIVK